MEAEIDGDDRFPAEIIPELKGAVALAEAWGRGPPPWARVAARAAGA